MITSENLPYARNSNGTLTPGDMTGFDFEGHGRRAAEAYQRARSRYEAFASEVKGIIVEVLRMRGLKVASVEARAKAVDSFQRKASLQLEGSPSGPKYVDPLNEITDLAAARIITFFISDIQKVEQIINSEFVVTER